jgi:hypothetical protein
MEELQKEYQAVYKQVEELLKAPVENRDHRLIESLKKREQYLLIQIKKMKQKQK